MGELLGRLSIEELEEMSNNCRLDIVRMTHAAKSGHPGGSLSAIDLIVGLYGSNFRFRTDEPSWPDRDRFILSKGHASPAMYSLLHQLGVISEDDIMSFREIGSVCQGHVDMKWTEGVDFSAGSLGMGLSFGLGGALAAKMDSSERQIWVMLGDGETQEGEVWEAAMSASFHEAGNLKVIIDRNGIQNDDFVNKQMEIGDIESKFSAFGWRTKEIDGHEMTEVVNAIDWAISITDQPVAIIANTVKGKGVSFMENNPDFHGKAPSDDELAIALEELT